jgi:hypothetical protein
VSDRYHIARRRHLGQMLDRLRDQGLLRWRWDYEKPPGRGTGRAVYWIALPGQAERKLDTRGAEQLVQRMCDQQDIVWKPVPHPGGEDQLAGVQAWIAAETRRRTSSHG